MVSLVLAAMMGAALGSQPPAKPYSPSVAIILKLTSPIPATVVEQTMLEVERVLKPTQGAIEWREMSSVDSGETFRGIFVVTLQGDCDLSGCLLMHRDHPVMVQLKPLGYAASTDNRIMPFATVYCDRIRDQLAPIAARVENSLREKMLGVAIGRVVAHELFHMITRSAGHAKRGLAKSYYTPYDLAVEPLDFEPQQIEMMRSEIGPQPRTEIVSGF